MPERSGLLPSGGLAFGGDYNPEQWPDAVRVDDIRLMREAGVNLVTLGVFSWGSLEPTEGSYAWDWLDDSIDRLHEAGIAVDLATPTAAPPIWLHRRHPEILPVTRTGQRYAQGGRLGWCASHPLWREAALSIVRAVTERYGAHPAVRMWHLGNELGGGNRHCYCDESAAHFRRWLRDRYGDVEVLNTAWGTAFWGHRYPSIDDVLPPRDSETIGRGNPALVLDFDRFSSDALLEHLRAEAAVVRAASPGVPLTTNFMVGTGPHPVDYAGWARHVDVVSTDHYLQAADPSAEQDVAYAADRTRGMRPEQPWLLMETAAGAVSWQPRSAPPLPGQLRRTAFSHVARGSDGVLFFQWRQSVAGAEQFHSGMIGHAGATGRVWDEVVALGENLARVGELAGSLVQPARIAVIADDESAWAWESGPKPVRGYPLARLARRWHAALFDRGVRCDVLPSPAADRLDGTLDSALDGYDVVLVPGLFLARRAVAAALEAVVARGGRVIVSHLSGIVDGDDRVVTGGYPGVFRDLLGVLVDEFVPLLEGETAQLDAGLSATVWTESVVLADAEAVHRHVGGRLDGRAAVTRRRVPSGGEAWYLSADLDDRSLAEVLADAAGLAPSDQHALDVVRRTAGVDSWLIAINHRDAPASLAATGVELLTGAAVDGRVEVPAGGVVVIRET